MSIFLCPPGGGLFFYGRLDWETVREACGLLWVSPNRESPTTSQYVRRIRKLAY
jgi:hypothetical protein